jgi:hypothetical protein
MIAPELFLWSERSEIEWLQAKMSKCEVFHIASGIRVGPPRLRLQRVRLGYY